MIRVGRYTCSKQLQIYCKDYLVTTELELFASYHHSHPTHGCHHGRLGWGLIMINPQAPTHSHPYYIHVATMPPFNLMCVTFSRAELVKWLLHVARVKVLRLLAIALVNTRDFKPQHIVYIAFLINFVFSIWTFKPWWLDDLTCDLVHIRRYLSTARLYNYN